MGEQKRKQRRTDMAKTWEEQEKETDAKLERLFGIFERIAAAAEEQNKHLAAIAKAVNEPNEYGETGGAAIAGAISRSLRGV